ncbi:MAG TPA: FG-GAP-like repeat-containing protein [Candidatus Acidoferrum sp.]
MAQGIWLVGPGNRKTLGSLLLLSLCGSGLLCALLPGQSAKPEEQARPREIALQVIVVNTAEQANKVLERLKAGYDFAALAKEKSIDPTADSGGYMGRMDRASLRPELREALERVGTGQISDITRIPSGYAILKVLPESQAAEIENAPKARLQALSAFGSVIKSPGVSGFGDANDALLRFPKAQGWERDFVLGCQMRTQSLAAATEGLQKVLAPSNHQALDQQNPLDVMQQHVALGELNAYQGKMDAAIEQYEEAYRIATEKVPRAVPLMEFTLGIAHLHRSDMVNEAFSAPGEKCLFPMRPGNAYKKTEDAQKAIEYFSKCLEYRPESLDSRWFMNLAYASLGEYPERVPEKYRMPLSLFESKERVDRFVDVAPAVGVNTFSMAGGVIVDDFENHGRLDILTSSMDMCQPLRYFRNNGDGTFTDRAREAGLAKQMGGLNIIQTDYNNDGCTDFLVLRGGWEFPERLSLLKNNCDGTFTDVTDASGLGETLVASQTAVWADINNDGLLDLFVGNESGGNQLFLNKGDGTFENISRTAGIDKPGQIKSVVAADYDNDGYVDFYVTDYLGENRLYHNNHDNTFTDVAAQAGVAGLGPSFVAWFFDYDNCGLPDLFVTSYFVSVDESIRTYLGLPHNAGTLKLYKNLGNGTFRDVTVETGLDKVFMPMGANFGDIDNDGFLDIYLGNGNPSYASVLPHVLLRNHEGKYFVDVTASSGTGEIHKGHGVAFADLQRRGYEDIVTETGGATPGDRHTLRLFANTASGNDWINLKLVGVKSNRPAIGARIKVTVNNEGKAARAIYRTVGSGGSFGASPLEQHIGLGKSAQIEKIEVDWAGSGTHQSFTGVGKNQFWEIREDRKEAKRLERRAVPFPMAKSKVSDLSREHSGESCGVRP